MVMEHVLLQVLALVMLGIQDIFVINSLVQIVMDMEFVLVQTLAIVLLLDGKVQIVPFQFVLEIVRIQHVVVQPMVNVQALMVVLVTLDGQEIIAKHQHVQIIVMVVVNV